MRLIFSILLVTVNAFAIGLVAVDPKTGATIPAEKIPSVDPYRVKTILGSDPNYSFAATLSKLSEDDRKKLWEEQLRHLIYSAFNSNSVGMQTYVNEWSQASGISVEQIQTMVQRVYVESQVNRSRAENEIEKFSLNQATLKSFGLSNSLSLKDTDLLISSGYSADYKSKSVADKLALLDKLSPEAKAVFLTRTFALAGIEQDDRVFSWLESKAPEQARFDLAIRAMNNCLRAPESTGGKCDFRYLKFLDPAKMSNSQRCDFVQNLKNEGTMASAPISTALKTEIQKKLSYLPTTMSCLSGISPEAIVPNSLLGAFDAANVQNSMYRIQVSAVEKPLPKLSGCSIEKSSSLNDMADALETILFSQSRRGQKVRSGFNSDNPNCVLMLSIEESKKGTIEVSGSAYSGNYANQIPKIEFKNRQELKDYIQTLRLKARQLWQSKEKGATLNSSSKSAPVNR